MPRGQFGERFLLSAGVVLALLLGAATLYAAGSVGRGGESGPRLSSSAEGAISLSNSKDGAAILDLTNIGPGVSGEGEVTIGNTGSGPGTLTLTAVERSDSPGFYGGFLSQMLELRIVELAGGGRESDVYAGELDAMPELALGTLGAGESRSYRFTVAMRDGGAPESPYVGDNLYQRATTRLGYEWTLTEAEPGGGGGGEEEPEPGAPAPSPVTPPAVAPVPPAEAVSPPAEAAPVGQILHGSAKPETLLGGPKDDRIYGLGGADAIFGRGGNDRLFGGSGADRISGGPGADQIHGGAGSDRLTGGSGRDRIYGGSGDDVIFARDGAADTVDCGPGYDIAYVDARDRVSGCERVSGPSPR